MPRAGLPRAIAILATLMFFAVLIRTAWISDDAEITLRTVLNVTHGFGLTYNAGERVQTFTHPLWALLLTLAYVVIGNVYFATFTASIATSLAAFWLAITRAASTWQAIVVGVVLLLSRAFVDYSTSGLENPLACVLLAAAILAWQRHADAPARRVRAITAIASLLYLTRPDAVLLVLPLIAVACWQAPWRSLARPLVVGALPAIAWTIFALVYYGFPFPNTAYAKLGMHIPHGELWRQGWLYLVDSMDRDPLTLTAIAFAVVSGFTQRRLDVRAWAAGVALYLIYVASIGGDFMAGRFLVAPLFASVVLLGTWVEAPRAVWAGVAGLCLVLGLASPHVPLASDAHFEDAAMRATGIVDERGVYFKDRSLVRATRLTFDEPDWPSARAPRPPHPNVLRTCGLMGSAGLEFGPNTYLLDECALADPLLARLPAVFNTNWRTGHYRRMVPDGYEDSLAHGENELHDANLKAYYDDLRTVTRAPSLWSSARWRAIARMNLGRDDHLVNVAYYRHEGAIVALPDLTTPTPDGTPPNAPGVRPLTAPLAITCDVQRGRRYLDVMLDTDATYRLYFLRDEATVGTLDLGPIPEFRRHPGLASFTVDLPPRASAEGMDTMVIAAMGKPPHPAMGQFLLDGYAPTQRELDQRIAERERPIR